MTNTYSLWANAAVDITYKPDTEIGLRMQSVLSVFAHAHTQFCFMKAVHEAC